MILITGANGKTGRAVIKALLSKGERIRAFVRRTEQIEDIQSLGEMDVVTGDMLDQKAVNEALAGIRAVYHICSAMNPDEVQIGQVIIQAARLAKVEHFVFHSVIHPVIQEMPHHHKKLMVEELLVNSGIPYTIIQPGILMQNILESWKPLSEEGIFRQKYFTTQETHIGMIDLDDLAEAAAIILTRPGHAWASYEFSGPENLSLSDMTAAMEQHFGREIKVETPPDDMFAAQLKKRGSGDYQINTTLTMFQHYNEHGSVGNSNVLTWILGRKPNDFSSFILRTLTSKN
ncbi:SDR family oxidoreductase [Paenibacillus glycinis]|uniref:NmrA family NAD(P)-binding protein n=1 Tax=Paenibacillus glycinis TaxID=2697035 RepID=A0ABW9XQU2_9BACL|nr:NmrA family NAD(P)-binding protein [Paenibacillus glycinis]NBD25012.1 NmrA family NAD(P)-binding protein [Paenibacillus glycinis]